MPLAPPRPMHIRTFLLVILATGSSFATESAAVDFSVIVPDETCSESYRQTEYKLVDPQGDYCLLKRAGLILRYAKNHFKGPTKKEKETVKEEMEMLRQRLDVGGAIAKVFENETPSGIAEEATAVIEGRNKPVRIKQTVQMFTQVMVEEAENGILPQTGTFHEWTPGFRKKYWKSAPLFAGFSKLLVALSMGALDRFARTDKEDGLVEWMLKQPDNSITLESLFRSSYRLNAGDVYLTLVTIENVLSRNWMTPHREALETTRKLTHITNHYRQRGADKYGAWYHLFGIMLYGYTKGALKAFVVGTIESIGSHISSRQNETQEDWINYVGGFIGAKLRKVVRSEAVMKAASDPLRLQSSFYLSLNEDYRDRLPVVSNPDFVARIRRIEGLVVLESASMHLKNCTVDIIPDLGNGYDSREKITRELKEVKPGQLAIIPIMPLRPRAVRLYMSGCEADFGGT